MAVLKYAAFQYLRLSTGAAVTSSVSSTPGEERNSRIQAIDCTEHLQAGGSEMHARRNEEKKDLYRGQIQVGEGGTRGEGNL